MSLSKLRNHRTELLVCLFLVAATLAVYWQMWGQDFINFDDNIYVTENRPLQGGLSTEGIRWAFTNTRQAGMWLPLTWLSLMLDHDLYSLKAGGYKFTNLLFHLANILLLLVVLHRMTGKFWRSLFVAALFGLHPLRVESVAWVTERKDVLSTFFWLLTLLAYLRYLAQPNAKRYLLILLAFTLGLMAKPMLVTLPFLLLVLDFWPLGRWPQPGSGKTGKSAPPPQGLGGQGPQPLITLGKEKLPLLLVAGLVSVGTIIAGHEAETAVSLEYIPLGYRLANAMVAYLSYIGKTIYPLSLGLLYPHLRDALPLGQVAGAGLLLALISATVLRQSHRRPYLLVGWLWYLGTLLPVIGLVQVGSQAMADRFTYIPGIGLSLMGTWWLAESLPAWRQRAIFLAALAVSLLTAASYLSWRQVQFWADSQTLYRHTIKVTSDNWLLNNNLGVTLFDAGKVEEASQYYQEALRIRPDYPEAHNNLGLALANRGKTAEAINQYAEALRLKPDYPDALNNWGFALATQGKTQEAIVQYVEALRLRPDYAEAHNYYGLALAEQGNSQAAEAQFSEAIRLKPTFAPAYNNLGKSLKIANRLEEALAQFTKAVQLKADYVEAYINLGIVLTMQGRPAEAVSPLREALRQEPDNVEAHNAMGITLAQQGNLPEAIKHFSQALRLVPNNSEAAKNLQTAQEMLRGH